jgi:hypothetical protein
MITALILAASVPITAAVTFARFKLTAGLRGTLW